MQANLKAHQHNTARSETLYAILVEGVGPLGSVFSRDDFSDREVKDTDGDGLPEFVDAWGQPLQFFRWPLLYHTDTQRGQVIDYWDYTQAPPQSEAIELFNPPYRSPFEAREQDPLDPNQQLMAPAWWSSSAQAANPSSPFASLGGTAGSVGGSGGVVAFEYFFHRLTEPLVHTGNTAFYWDRGSFFPYRRAFFFKPLILSAGPDRQPGVFLYPQGTVLLLTNPTLGLIANENNALTFSVANVPVPVGHPPWQPRTGMDLTDFTVSETVPSGPVPTATSFDPDYPSTYDLLQAGQDDISNQNRQATGGPGGS